MTRAKHLEFKYLLESEQDIQWGLTVTTAGYESVAPGVDYPLHNHPSRYLFSPKKGRILDEYQLIYIISGKGNFVSQNCKLSSISEGDVFMLFPGEWHNYSCDKETGWDVYCIGFKGINIDNRCIHGFFNRQKPLFHVGINEFMVNIFQEAIRTAHEQHVGFQQMLAGCVNHLLGIVYAVDKQLYTEQDVAININKAKLIMQENILSNLTPEDIAKQVNMSYSSFRTKFKKHTGFAPYQYLMELKIHKIKELLVTTRLPGNEIAYVTGFENADHCCAFFKKRTNMTLMTYRKFVQGNLY
jgi:AraC-like DNA-binding protein